MRKKIYGGNLLCQSGLSLLVLVACLMAGAGIAQADVLSNALAKAQLDFASGNGEYTAWGAAYARLLAADRAVDAAWMACKTPAQVAARADAVRAATIAALGGFPERTPLNVQVTGRVVRDGYVIEKIIYESRPKHYVTAHLFLPDSPAFKPPYPAIVVPCGHSLTGKDFHAYQRGPLQAAKAGIAVLLYDPIDQGERAQLPQHKTKFMSCNGHNHIGRKAALVGWNTAQFRIWDGMRAFDVLCERSDVDPKRLGVMGHSGGGTLSSYLMALEPRVRCAAPSGYLSTLRDVVRDIGPQDAEQNIFGQLSYGFNHLSCIMLRAPRPTLFVCSHMDFFAYEGSVETFDHARELYGRVGAPCALSMADAQGNHHWNESTRTASVDWMRYWLKGDMTAPERVDMDRYRLLDVGFSYKTVDVGLCAKPEARVTPTGQVMDLPGARSVYDILRDEAMRLARNRAPVTPDIVKRVTGIRVEAPARTVNISEEVLTDGTLVRRATLVRDDSVPVPTIAFRNPKACKGTPVLLAGDWSNLAKRAVCAARVRALLREGRSVMVAELRAFGETGTPKNIFYGTPDADESIAVMYYMLGESLVQHRAEDLLAAAREFSAWCDARPIDLEVSGRAVVPAAHAWYLARATFGAFRTDPERTPKSWQQVVCDPLQAFRFACIVHGGLRAYDWTDLIK